MQINDRPSKRHKTNTAVPDTNPIVNNLGSVTSALQRKPTADAQIEMPLAPSTLDKTGFESEDNMDDVDGWDNEELDLDLPSDRLDSSVIEPQSQSDQATRNSLEPAPVSSPQSTRRDIDATEIDPGKGQEGWEFDEGLDFESGPPIPDPGSERQTTKNQSASDLKHASSPSISGHNHHNQSQEASVLPISDPQENTAESNTFHSSEALTRTEQLETDGKIIHDGDPKMAIDMPEVYSAICSLHQCWAELFSAQVASEMQLDVIEIIDAAESPLMSPAEANTLADQSFASGAPSLSLFAASNSFCYRFHNFTSFC